MYLLEGVGKDGVDCVGEDDGQETTEERDEGKDVEVEAGEGCEGREEERKLRGEDGPEPGHDGAGAQGGGPEARGDDLGRHDVGEGEAGGGAELAEESEGGLERREGGGETGAEAGEAGEEEAEDEERPSASEVHESSEDDVGGDLYESRQGVIEEGALPYGGH